MSTDMERTGDAIIKTDVVEDSGDLKEVNATGTKGIEVKPATKPQAVRSVPTGRRGRVKCAGGCGTMVIRSLGECRKCRKARRRDGLKHILNSQKVSV